MGLLDGLVLDFDEANGAPYPVGYPDALESDREVLATYAGGATAGVMGDGVVLFGFPFECVGDPDQRDAVAADISLLPSAVEEMLRCAPAVLHFRRTALRDTVIRGTEIKEGDKVVMWYPSANRDEEIFDDPQTFNVARRFNEHLAFGTGEHYCLGASLARLQLNSIFRELLTRLPDIEVDGEVDYLRSNFIDGIKRMNVRFTPESRREQRAS